MGGLLNTTGAIVYFIIKSMFMFNSLSPPCGGFRAYNGYSSNAYSSVDKYRSPVSGKRATMFLPLFSGR